ncbi:hypothetical protein [Acinetobacter bereziniae]|uniref:hypothetical protein n=1 Tax=Acinetobacter bereziniae TaxID=106648 RepID=UPI001902A9C2|nr:hypothetical protein [Acinetobacter bereziniae]MBJ8553294.1 hypothetical protein [Acinetobacter bereziniae]
MEIERSYLKKKFVTQVFYILAIIVVIDIFLLNKSKKNIENEIDNLKIGDSVNFKVKKSSELSDLNIRKYKNLDNIFKSKNDNIVLLKVSIINGNVKIYGKVRNIFYLNQYVESIGAEYEIKKITNNNLWNDFEVEGFTNGL